MFVLAKCTDRETSKDICYIVYNITLHFPACVHKNYKKLSKIKHLLIDRISFNEDYGTNCVILQFSLDITQDDKLLIQEVLDDLNARELLLRM